MDQKIKKAQKGQEAYKIRKAEGSNQKILGEDLESLSKAELIQQLKDSQELNTVLAQNNASLRTEIDQLKAKVGEDSQMKDEAKAGNEKADFIDSSKIEQIVAKEVEAEENK